jgi:DNA-binding PadR family transcriptional regulator
MLKKPAEPDPQSLLPLPVAVFHILVALADEERHGYAIMQDVADRTGGQLKLSAGTLYGAIKRMLEDGLIEETPERPDAEYDDERRRYYRVTSFGRKAAMAEAARLSQLLSRAKAIGWLPKRG